MMKTENTVLQMIAGAARCPEYGLDMVKTLMEKLDMNERAFALLMNVAPSTIRLWTSGAARPDGSCRFTRPGRRSWGRSQGSLPQRGGILKWQAWNRRRRCRNSPLQKMGRCRSSLPC